MYGGGSACAGGFACAGDFACAGGSACAGAFALCFCCWLCLRCSRCSKHICKSHQPVLFSLSPQFIVSPVLFFRQLWSVLRWLDWSIQPQSSILGLCLCFWFRRWCLCFATGPWHLLRLWLWCWSTVHLGHFFVCLDLGLDLDLGPGCPSCRSDPDLVHHGQELPRSPFSFSFSFLFFSPSSSFFIFLPSFLTSPPLSASSFFTFTSFIFSSVL